MGQVVISLEKDVLHVKAGQTVTTTLHLRNSATEKVSGRVVIKPDGIMLLSSDVREVTLAPNETRPIVLKFFVKETTNNRDNNSCAVSFTSAVNNIGLTKKIRFVVERKRRIVLVAQEQPVLMQSAKDTVRWRVQIMNRGNSEEPLSVRYAAIPGGFRFMPSPPMFTLAAGMDTTVIVRAVADEQLGAIQKPQISISVSTPNNLLLASAYCIPLIVSNRFSDRAQDLLLQGNYLDVSARNLFTGTPFLQTTLMSAHANGNNALDVRLQSLWFYQQNQSFLTDSYIYLKQGALFAKAGSITDLQEVILNGQGVRAGAEMGKDLTASYTYLHDNNNQLRFSSEKGSIKVPRVTTHAVDLDFTREQGFSFHTQAMYREDGREGLTSRLGSLSWQYNEQQLINLRGVVGFSDETVDSTGKRYTAAAGGLDITGTAGRYSWVSSNYVSGRHYAGFRRGHRFFDERFNMLLTEKLQLGVRYFQQANAPALMNELVYNFLPESDEQESGEVSLRIMPSPNFSVTLRPYRNWQRVNYRPQSIPDFSSVSDRLAMDILWQTPSGFFATTTYDIGSTQYNINRAKANVFQSHRLNMNLGYSWFSFSGWGQIAPYYLREYVNMDRVYQTYRTLQFGPTFQKTFLKGQLQTMATAQWIYQDALPGWMSIYTGRAAWQAAKHWLVHADYSLLGPGRYDFSNLSAGVSFLFGKPIGTPRPARHRLSFYEDRNNNDVRDAGEPGLKGVLVHVGEHGLVSGEDGNVVYESSNSEERIARVAAPGGWMTDGQLLLPAGRGVRALSVPMKKSAGITGQVQWEKGRYSQYAQSSQGWLVEATGGSGKLYQAYVSNEGRFRLWLPPGVYDVALRQVQPTGNFHGIPSQVVVLNGHEEATLQFRVKENEGGAIIKHFGKTNK
ncbi:hypothetical protein MKQ68_24315 [Chitinophaga horti]|uniref:Uncharacterized protein n=1 Tax=Chitinophaga horti TaxID=2920382 RepID=A0ABY6J1C4_9BACT|nr:hypothetical protein [Chitinophaga horti]UYQ93211.1 hypothetical protein MKQ68_24315 [Chitinophaga horti]